MFVPLKGSNSMPKQFQTDILKNVSIVFEQWHSFSNLLQFFKNILYKSNGIK
jgi:hypothetical protein